MTTELKIIGLKMALDSDELKEMGKETDWAKVYRHMGEKLLEREQTVMGILLEEWRGR